MTLLGKLQKRIYRTVGPSLAASFEPLAHCWNVASLSLFYRYYIGRCSSELAQLVPLSFSWWRATCYSDRLHHFAVTIPKCYKDVYFNSFFPRTARIWNSLPLECFPLTYNLLNSMPCSGCTALLGVNSNKYLYVYLSIYLSIYLYLYLYLYIYIYLYL